MVIGASQLRRRHKGQAANMACAWEVQHACFASGACEASTLQHAICTNKCHSCGAISSLLGETHTHLHKQMDCSISRCYSTIQHMFLERHSAFQGQCTRLDSLQYIRKLLPNNMRLHLVPITITRAPCTSLGEPFSTWYLDTL